MPKSQPLILSDLQKDVLRQVIHEPDISNRLLQRAQIVLASSQGIPISKVARQHELSFSVVAKCRLRWRGMAPVLNSAELDGDIETLREAIIETLSSTAHPRKIPEIDDEQLDQILAIWREDPRESGRNIEFWTMRTVADECVKRGIVDYMSASKLSAILRKIKFRNREIPSLAERRVSRN